MSGRLLNYYRKEWPRVGAVAAMALGGASLLAVRKKPMNLRALAVMGSMSMAAHQFEEYVEPGWFPGMVNKGLFKSDNPRSWPYNPNSAMCANAAFTALYIPPILFPKVKWLVMPTVVLGITQAIAHSVLMPTVLHRRYPYTPGSWTAALIQVPLGITYAQALQRQEGALERSDVIKAIGVLATFMALGVATPNVTLADKNTPYQFTKRQMGTYDAADADDSTEA
jgi:hypothetical protein